MNTTTPDIFPAEHADPVEGGRERTAQIGSIPALDTDLIEFMRLPAGVRKEVELWQQELARVAPPIQQSLREIASRLGCSPKTARTKYDAWRHAGRDWRTLVNRAKAPNVGFANGERGLNPELIEFWKKLCLENTRSRLAAYRELVRRFKSGAPVPGIPQGECRLRLPKGCTYENLMRHKPTRLETEAGRIGRSAAANFRPKLFTTRVGLRVGQRYLFDDMWHDFKVVCLGQRKPMRLLQLHAHDLLSGCQFARGLKPRIEDPDSGKSVGLREDEMLCLVAHVLTETGYDGEGCVLMVEHGTAAIREALERMLFDLSGGRLIVERSGMEGASAFAGQYAGRGKGNFRFKASLESLGNLIHNETANVLQFPGQTGSNSRINLPEELAGREKHAITLELAMLALPPLMRAKLALPFLEVNEAIWLVHEVMERINRRTEHALEGWVECGHVTTDFAVPGVGVIPAEAYRALTPEKRAAVDAVAAPEPRKLSPREVFDAGRGRLTRFRPEQCARLLADRQGVEVTVGFDHLITFEDAGISPEPLRYLAHHYAPGDKFKAVVNPWAPQTLHLFCANGAWAGVADAWQRIRRDDVEGLHRQMGRAAAVEKQLLAPLAARGAELTKLRLESSSQNAEALKGFSRKENAERQAQADAATEALMSGF